MRQFGAGVIWEGFLEVELNQVLKARKKGEREERKRGPGKGNCVNNDTEDVYSWGQGWSAEARVAGGGTSTWQKLTALSPGSSCSYLETSMAQNLHPLNQSTYSSLLPLVVKSNAYVL